MTALDSMSRFRRKPNGEQSNSGRHAFGDITVGVIDIGLEDSTSRHVGRG